MYDSYKELPQRLYFYHINISYEVQMPYLAVAILTSGLFLLSVWPTLPCGLCWAVSSAWNTLPETHVANWPPPPLYTLCSGEVHPAHSL